jgi:hypothetical protein
LGYPKNAGFEYAFRELVPPSTPVSVRFADGHEFNNSPIYALSHDGYLENCNEFDVVGWAASDRQPAELEILVDDKSVIFIRCDLPRPDLARLGITERVGFRYRFPRRLSGSAVVSVRFADGAHINNSPCRITAHDPVASASGVVGSPYRASALSSEHALPGRIAIVVGMHRSGTSLCANLMHLLGVDMADEIDAVPSNQRGQWERKELVAFHDRILRLFGRDWYSLRHALQLPPEWWSRDEVRAVRDEMIVWLCDRRQAAGSFGFKDPRTALLMPLWDQICAMLDLEPRFVFCVRDPVQVARSLAARDGMSIGQGEYRWMVYNSHAVLDIGKRSICIIPYEAWFNAPMTTLARLASHLNLASVAESSAVDRMLKATIDPLLHHGADQSTMQALSPCAELYQQILDCVPHGCFSDAVRDTAAAFVGFEALAQPMLDANLSVQSVDLRRGMPHSPLSKAPGGDDLAATVRWVSRIVDIIGQYAEELQSIVAGLQRQASNDRLGPPDKREDSSNQ